MGKIATIIKWVTLKYNEISNRIGYNRTRAILLYLLIIVGLILIKSVSITTLVGLGFVLYKSYQLFFKKILNKYDFSRFTKTLKIKKKESKTEEN